MLSINPTRSQGKVGSGQRVPDFRANLTRDLVRGKSTITSSSLRKCTGVLACQYLRCSDIILDIVLAAGKKRAQERACGCDSKVAKTFSVPAIISIFSKKSP